MCEQKHRKVSTNFFPRESWRKTWKFLFQEHIQKKNKEPVRSRRNFSEPRYAPKKKRNIFFINLLFFFGIFNFDSENNGPNFWNIPIPKFLVNHSFWSYLYFSEKRSRKKVYTFSEYFKLNLRENRTEIIYWRRKIRQIFSKCTDGFASKKWFWTGKFSKSPKFCGETWLFADFDRHLHFPEKRSQKKVCTFFSEFSNSISEYARFGTGEIDPSVAVRSCNENSNCHRNLAQKIELKNNF